MNNIGGNPIRRRIEAFRNALRGIALFFNKEAHARIHAALAAVAIGLGIALKISRTEWVILLFTIGSVFAAEALNSALEELADAVHPERHPGIGRAKDLAAAAVLLTAIAAALVGGFIFIPYLLR